MCEVRSFRLFLKEARPDRSLPMPIALNINADVGADRASLLMGVRSLLTYTDRTEYKC